jgi:hypothetical protein
MPKSKRKEFWVLESLVCDWDGYAPTYVVAVVHSRSAARRRLAAWARAVNAEGGGYCVCELTDSHSGAAHAEAVAGSGAIGDRRAWRSRRGAYRGCVIRPDGSVRYPWE